MKRGLSWGSCNTGLSSGFTVCRETVMRLLQMRRHCDTISRYFSVVGAVIHIVPAHRVANLSAVPKLT